MGGTFHSEKILLNDSNSEFDLLSMGGFSKLFTLNNGMPSSINS